MHEMLNRVVDDPNATLADYFAAASMAAFYDGCCDVLEIVPRTHANRDVFQADLQVAMVAAGVAYMNDPKNKADTGVCFGPGTTPSDEQLSAHAKCFHDFFVEKGRAYVQGLIDQGCFDMTAVVEQ